MSENNDIKTTPNTEEQEIDLIELARKVWAGRKLVLKACGVALLIGLVVALSISQRVCNQRKTCSGNDYQVCNRYSGCIGCYGRY